MRSVKGTMLLGLLLVFMSSETIAKQKVIQPYLHNKKVKVKSGDKKPTQYYQLSKKFGTLIKANGPGKVSVYVRIPIEEGAKQTQPFSLKYTVDGKKVKVRKVGAIKLSKKAKIVGSKKNLSVVKKINLVIPPGKHKVDFIALNTRQKVFVKFYFTKYPNPKWQNAALVQKSTDVKLTSIKKKKQLTYQRISSKKGVKFKAKEKTYIRVLIRGEFKSHMFADNTLRIHIKENGKILNTIQISSNRSKSILYTDGGKLVPGTLNKFFMQVPKGNHEYEIVVADKSKSALVKVSFDKKRYPSKKKGAKKKSKKKKKNG